MFLPFWDNIWLFWDNFSYCHFQWPSSLWLMFVWKRRWKSKSSDDYLKIIWWLIFVEWFLLVAVYYKEMTTISALVVSREKQTYLKLFFHFHTFQWKNEKTLYIVYQLHGILFILLIYNLWKSYITPSTICIFMDVY